MLPSRWLYSPSALRVILEVEKNSLWGVSDRRQGPWSIAIVREVFSWLYVRDGTLTQGSCVRLWSLWQRKLS